MTEQVAAHITTWRGHRYPTPPLWPAPNRKDEIQSMAKMKKGELFARLSLDYPDHPKIAGLSDAAFRAHIEMMIYARRFLTDGVIPMRVAMRYALHVIDELCSNDDDAPSVSRNEDGSLTLHGYADFQETRAEVEDRRRSARARAQARWNGKPASNAVRNAASNAVSNPETETETEIYTHTASGARESAPSRFDEWWSAWDKKKAKGDARKAYSAAVPKKISHDDLMVKTRAYWEHVKRTGTDPQYVPYPATWLRGEQWDDDMTGPQQNPTINPLTDW